MKVPAIATGLYQIQENQEEDAGHCRVVLDMLAVPQRIG
jgi:hypothetical protein